MITFEILGERIRSKREYLKISRKDLSDSLIKLGLNISRDTISNIENGSRATTALELRAIGELLSITSEELMREIEEMDLIGWFRSRGNQLSGEEASELEEIQEFIKGLIAQKKIASGAITLKQYESEWGTIGKSI